MVFGFLKPSYKLEIQPEQVPPTGPVNYTVVLDVLKPKEIKKLHTSFKVVLEGQTRCDFREKDEEGEETTESRVEYYGFTLTRKEKVLLEKTSPGKGRYTYQVSIPLDKPLPLPGSYRYYNIKWIVQAEIPGLLRSTKATRELIVTPPGGPGEAQTTTVYLGDIKVEAEVPSYTPRGVPFQVKIRLEPTKESVECKKITAVLANKIYTSKWDISPSAERCDTIQESREYQKETLGENIKLNPGEQYEATLSFTVPASESPSFSYQSSYSQWKIILSCSKGILKEDKTEIPIIVV